MTPKGNILTPKGNILTAEGKTNQLKAYHYLGGPELIWVHHAEQHLLHGAHAQILPVELRCHTAPYLDTIQSERFTPFFPKLQSFFLNTMVFKVTTNHFIYYLAWKPSAAQATHSYSRHLPALELFYRETEFSL